MGALAEKITKNKMEFSLTKRAMIVVPFIILSFGVYLSNLGYEYPSGGDIFVDIEGKTYDYNSSAQLENYKNGVVSITVGMKSDRIRSIADPAYGGTTVVCTNPATGFSASVALPDNTNLWGTQITAVNTVLISAWGSDDSDVIKMTAVLTPDSAGQLSAGSLISIILAPYGVDNAYDQTVVDNRMTDATMWDENNTINVIIVGRDPVSLSGFDGAYLQGSPWAA